MKVKGTNLKKIRGGGLGVVESMYKKNTQKVTANISKKMRSGIGREVNSINYGSHFLSVQKKYCCSIKKIVFEKERASRSDIFLP